MANKIYAGVSAFFANRTGMHNWLDNHARPLLSVCRTHPDGKKNYFDMFVSRDEKVSVTTDTKARTIKVPANSTAIVFPNDLARPLFSILDKPDSNSS